MARFLIFISILVILIIAWTAGTTTLVTNLFLVLTPYQYLVIWIPIVGSLFFVAGILAINLRPHPWWNRVYQLGALSIGGMGTVMFTIIPLYVLALFTGIRFEWWASPILYFLFILFLNAYGLYKGFTPIVTKYSLNIAKKHAWHGKRIGLVADTHYGNVYGKKSAKKLVDRLNTLGVEIVIIPGDFFDGPKIDYRGIAQIFTHIQAPHGVVFTNGNHEEYRNTEAMLEAFRKADIRVLNDAKTEIDGIVFAGVTYHITETVKGLKREIDALELDENKPVILLKHKPTLHDVLSEYPIDLVVSGHTHRGQSWPISLVTRAMFGKYAYGAHQLKNLTAITTSGVGTWGPPQRIGTEAEIVVIEIV